MMLESGIEGAFGRKIQEWAQDSGLELAYLKVQLARGWPDRLVVAGNWELGASYYWIEFKAPGEKLRPMQVHIHKLLKKMGAKVYVFDDYRAALEAIKAEIAASGLLAHKTQL